MSGNQERLTPNEGSSQITIWKKIESLSLSTRTGAHAGYSDQEFVRILEEGLQEQNLDKIYEVIEATERGCGVWADDASIALFSQAFAEDPDRLGKLIASRNNLRDYYYILEALCTREMRIHFAQMTDVSPLFLYECARQLLRDPEQSEHTRAALVCGISTAAAHDPELWIRWIRHMAGQKEWQQLMGQTLSKIPQAALLAYAEHVDLFLSPGNGNLPRLTDTFRRLPDEAAERILKAISGTVCRRWHAYLEDQRARQNTHLDFLLTGYTNLIIWCIQDQIDTPEDFQNLFREWVDVLESDRNGWYPSLTAMQSVFLTDMTQIFYLLTLNQSVFDGALGTCQEDLARLSFLLDSSEGLWGECERGREVREMVERKYQ